ncbi:diacylglycerol kinase [candidate division WOR-3 bacterium]|nr:diacylglycerol kinase [candidate division WOR-3 bacterium]
MAETEIGKSFFDALRGMKIAFKTQKHIHLHIFIFFLALYSIVFGGAGLKNSLALLAVATMVITAELINSSIEILCDFISPGQNEFIKNAKDLSAGAVLCATFSSIVFSYMILADSVMVSISRFSDYIVKTPLFFLVMSVFLFSIIVSIYYKRYYGKFSFPLEKTTFGLALLIAFLSLYSISVTFIFFLLIGGIILIEALLRNHPCDKVYFTGILAIITAFFCYRISSQINLYISNECALAFIIGLSPSLGSCYLASLGSSLTCSEVSILGEFLCLVFFVFWGVRFKNSFGKNLTNHKSSPLSRFYLLGLFVVSASPLPFSSAVVSASYAVAFSCPKKYSIPVSSAGFCLKYFLVFISFPPYGRIGA